MSMKMIPLECIAHGAGDQWEAICLDLDIAVQGPSLEEVTSLLRASIDTYITDALAQDEPVRSQMLHRSVPFGVRVRFAARMFFATLAGRRLDKQREATIGFPVECHA
jgi:hypothetical protein